MNATLAHIVAESCDSSSTLATSSSFAFLGDGTTREGGLSGTGAAGPRAACHLGLCRLMLCHSISPHSLAMTCA